MSNERIEEYLKIAEFSLDEGRKYIELGDFMQASEKFYNAAEKAIKALATSYAPEVHEESERRGRWTVGLLSKAVREISEKLNSGVRHYWDAAWYLHVEGFHEARLGIEDIELRLKDIERLVEFARSSSKPTDKRS